MIRKESLVLVGNNVEFQPHDQVSFIVFNELRDDALEWLNQTGWIIQS
jgi:hypothetical protein